MTDYSVATDSARSQLAKERLEIRFKLGRNKQAQLVDQVAALHIRDRLVWPYSMVFESIKSVPYVYVADSHRLASITSTPSREQVEMDAKSRPPIRIHPHALGQMVGAIQEERGKYNRKRKRVGEAEKHGPSIRYIRSVGAGTVDWEREQFRDTMDRHFWHSSFLDRRGVPTKFLFRLVGTNDDLELRGFVSRNFNIFLPSYPLLSAFMETCGQVGAQPVEASTTSVRFSLKCFLPYIFEPIPGEFIALGGEWSNSDFGAGRLTLSGCVMRVSSGNPVVLDKKLSRTHLGSIIEESDLELSEEALLAAVKAQCLAIRDTVKAQLEPSAANKILLAIKAAHEEHIPWERLERELGTLLRKKEVEQVHSFLNSGFSDIEDLPQPAFMKDSSGNSIPVATRWWASNVVSWLSTKEEDADRKDGLEKLAGSLLSK